MDTLLVEGCNQSINNFPLDCELLPSSSLHQACTRIRNFDLVDDPLIMHSNDNCGSVKLNPYAPAANPNIATNLPTPYSTISPDERTDQVSDFPDDCLKFISEILMEEDLDDQTASLYDYAALQATEKSLYDALAEAWPSSSDEYPPFLGQSSSNSYDDSHQSYSSHGSGHAIGENMVSASVSLESNSFPGDSFSEVAKGLAESPASTLLDLKLISHEAAKFDWLKETFRFAPNGGCGCGNSETNWLINQGTAGRIENNHKNDTTAGTKREGNWSRGQKNLTRVDIDYEEERKSKHLASHIEEYVEMQQYDDVLLCKEDGDGKLCCYCRDESSDNGEIGKSKGSKQKKARGKKKDDEGEAVDLTTLLTQCAQAVAIFDLRNANDLLKQIRSHSSPYGDSTQRIAHYFANALEARLAGTGWEQCRENTTQRIPFSRVLKAYREQVTAVPFRRASYFLANNAIAKLAEKATRIHVIDFGIFFGFQWPGLIQELSKRPIGPPMLRITGIDYPESGFRPARRVEETGQRLAEYCKRFKVPFEYQAIAKGWESITPKELNIDRDELLVVNCLYMSRKLVDETVEDKNPRDTFLRLIRKLNPDLFIHGIVNGTYSAPFFLTRFKEALFHYSSVFDMLEATIPRESEERLLVEHHLYGKDALNVIACEGTERVERPETYRQWQARIHRAGFRKLPLDYEVVKRVKDHVKQNHHKDFLVEDDGHWMFQGWKGRVLYAVSSWRLV